MKLSSILENYHITPQFPPGAVREAQNISNEVCEKDLKGRLDLTESLIFTIDGDDAKDFDDAVSLTINNKGNYVLGVHIADVSHYVKENSPIDKAAYLRGTSVYLIDTVIPMLPFELSNELCSLKPNEIRLTLSVFIEITPKGKIKNYEIFESYIKSKYRMTYFEAAEILNKNKALMEKYEALVPVLKDMRKLSDILCRERRLKGSIDFISTESKITLDKDGNPIDIKPYPMYVSNSIIEEFMLIANEMIAKHMNERHLPSVYRIHEEPNEEKIEKLKGVLPLLGVNNLLKGGKSPKDFQKIVESVKGKENETVVNYIVLRSMSKAKYSEINQGHFGLSKKYYCHFTSPIRRYPDLMVHRILKDAIHKKINEKNIKDYFYKTVCASLSSTAAEINAQDAEWEWQKQKKIEYMKDKIGEIYDGTISHITKTGFFVELSNTVEGFVPARTIEDDIYIMSDNGFSLIGVTTKKTFLIGDKVKIKVDFLDIDSKRLDFILVEKKTKIRKKVISKKARRTLKDIKKEGRKIREEREDLKLKTDENIDIFYKKMNNNILKPLSLKVGDKSSNRFIRTSFNDFLHINTNLVLKELSQRGQIDSEKYVSSTLYSFKMLISTLSESLNKDLDEEFKEMLSSRMAKDLNAFIRNISLSFKEEN